MLELLNFMQVRVSDIASVVTSYCYPVVWINWERICSIDINNVYGEGVWKLGCYLIANVVSDRYCFLHLFSLKSS